MKAKDLLLALVIAFTFFGLLTYYGYASFKTPEKTIFWSNAYYLGEGVIHCLLWLVIIFSCNPAPALKTILWLMFGTVALRLCVIIAQCFTSWYTITTMRIPLALWALTMVTICILLLTKKR